MKSESVCGRGRRADARFAANTRKSVCLWWMLCICLPALLAGCDSASVNEQEYSHPWLKPRPVTEEKSLALPPFLIYRVTDAVRAETIELLQTEPYIQISPSMASHYTGQEVRVPAEMRPFLIRGVDAGGELAIIQSASGLWVRAAASGTSTITHQPLVVLLDPTPIDIYISVDSAATN